MSNPPSTTSKLIARYREGENKKKRETKRRGVGGAERERERECVFADARARRKYDGERRKNEDRANGDLSVW